MISNNQTSNDVENTDDIE